MKLLNKVLLGILAVLVISILFLSVQCAAKQRKSTSRRSTETPLEEIPFDGKAAWDYLKALCDIGNRPSGSEGMLKQQKFLEEHFKKCGGAVEYQRFRFPHPEKGEAVPVDGANLIVRWKPERKERILLCAHYDTLPIPLLDPPGSTEPFLGANDNAGGVALLMELAKKLPEMLEKKQTRYGVDIVMLDAEEFMFHPRGRFFIGSEYFAKEYAAKTPKERGYTYTCAVLLDMISQYGLKIPKERYSNSWSDSRRFVSEIWNTARQLGVREFKSSVRDGGFLDDHLMLHEKGGIPALDIIDFDYEPWHTHKDTPEQCAPLSLARVGWVLQTWLEEKK